MVAGGAGKSVNMRTDRILRSPILFFLRYYYYLFRYHFFKYLFFFNLVFVRGVNEVLFIYF